MDIGRVNLTHALYVDTFSKRAGEAVRAGLQDDGLWVRLRHDVIGREDAFRSHNTMLQLGYDHKFSTDNGAFYLGADLDYLDDSLDYRNVSGSGDLNRYGLWLYGSYLAQSGLYSDTVLKMSRLTNDFAFSALSSVERISADYANYALSVSEELGQR